MKENRVQINRGYYRALEKQITIVTSKQIRLTLNNYIFFRFDQYSKTDS